MQKQFAIAAGALALGVISFCIGSFTAAPARAEIQYPWCAEYGGNDANATNCGFTTLAQCRATISGIGGRCYENPLYNAPATRAKKAKSH